MEDIGAEDLGKSKRVYLVTLPCPRHGWNLRSPGSYTREDISNAILDAVSETQGNRVTPLSVLRMCVFRERHADGGEHDHIALLADRCFRWAPLKRVLFSKYGLASHWSCSHDHYASAVAYGYVPTPKKPHAELDPNPYMYSVSGPHPPLATASRAPVTSAALAAVSEKGRLARAELGKAEKFTDVDVWPIVIRENILDGPHACEKFLAHAKRCGGEAMVKFCFRNMHKLPELISRSWRIEKVEEHVARSERSRMELLQDALRAPCVCGGQWLPAAKELFANNGRLRRASGAKQCSTPSNMGERRVPLCAMLV